MSKIHSLPETAVNEEINYSKLAIKFTKTLTKDMLFSGIRDILKKIGEYVDRVYEFDIDFTFGELRSKERRIKFIFNNHRLAEILPESLSRDMTSKALGYTMKPVDNASITSSKLLNDDALTIQSINDFYSNVDNTNTQKVSVSPIKSKRHQRPVTTDIVDKHSMHTNNEILAADSLRPYTVDNESHMHLEEDKYYDVAGGNEELHASSSSLSTYAIPNLFFSDINKSDDEKTKPNISPRTIEILQEMEEAEKEGEVDYHTKLARSVLARQQVSKQAFQRCLETVEKSSNSNDYLDYQIDKLEQNAIAKDRLKKEKLRKELDDLRQHLQSQMSHAKDKKVMDKKDRRDAKIAISLPSQLNVTDFATMNARKENLLKELDTQISLKNDLLSNERKAKLAEEKLCLERVSKEQDYDHILRRVDHLKKQKDLLDAWEKEAHIRNLKRLQMKGCKVVQDYMSATGLLEDLPSTKSFSAQNGMDKDTTSSSLSTSRVGVGFDSRRK